MLQRVALSLLVAGLYQPLPVRSVVVCRSFNRGRHTFLRQCLLLYTKVK